jgi:HAMP domain-containing protein
MKYSCNQGHININNPKLAARYFLNAIDRMESLKEKYEKTLQELEQNIPMLEKIVAKPFDKEDELGQLKKDVNRLEREITLKIQAAQMNEQEAAETPVVKMESKSLLPKKHSKGDKVRVLKY